MDFIPLTINQSAAVVHLDKGLCATIDADCWPVIGRLRWYAKRDERRWYAMATSPRGVRMHHLMLAARRGWDIDHADGNGLNNRRSNLRYATRPKNGANSTRAVKSNTGYRGAYWDKSEDKFVAKIMQHGKLAHLGRFNTAEEAAAAYDAAAIRVYGEFARLNFPPVAS